MNSEILGEGAQGIVICPPLLSDDENFVGKISNYRSLKKEYEILRMLPEDGPYDYRDIKLEKIESSEMDLISDRFNNEEEIYQLIIPKINGKELGSFFNGDDFCGSVKTWEEHISALLVLRHEIILLTDESIFHNDILPRNIMYDGEKMLLIDFGEATTENIDIKQIKIDGIEDEYTASDLLDIKNSDLKSINAVIHRYFKGMIKRKLMFDLFIEKDLITYFEIGLPQRYEDLIEYDEDGEIIHVMKYRISKYSQIEIDEYVESHTNEEILKHLYNHEVRRKMTGINITKIIQMYS